MSELGLKSKIRRALPVIQRRSRQDYTVPQKCPTFGVFFMKYNLVIVIGEFLELKVKVIQTGDELCLRRVASDDDKLLAEDAFDDKTAAVMLQSCLAKQFVETDILLFIKPERVFITRCLRFLSDFVCLFLVGIHIWLKKRSRLGIDHGLAEQAPLSDKRPFVRQRYSSLASSEAKNPRRKISIESLKTPPLQLPRAGLSRVQYYNRPGA